MQEHPNSPLRDAISEAVDSSVGGLLEAHRELVDEKFNTFDEKINGLQWKWAAALAGGQVVAGMVAALITRQPAVVEHASHALSSLPLI